MKNRILFTAVGGVLLLLVIALFFTKPSEVISDEDDSITRPTGVPSGEIQDRPPQGQVEEEEYSYGTPNPNDARMNRLPDGQVEWVGSIQNSRELKPELPQEDITLAILGLLNDYKFIFKGYPIGPDNRDFTRQLRGENKYKFIFIASDSPALKDGELVDSWGTPYFFHPVSSDNIEIISAGPDKEMWTEDDINPFPSSYLEEDEPVAQEGGGDKR